MYFSTTLILLLIVLDILVYYLQELQEEEDGQQKDSSSLSPFVEQSIRQEEHGETKDSSSSSSSSSLYKNCRAFSLAELELATNDFDDAFVIGKGGFGKVYKGKVDLEGGIDVAIKRSDPDSNQGATEYWAEIEMLSKFRHSHIVTLLGYCEKEMILVYEYLPNGSLGDHLHSNKANPLTWIRRLNICIDAARGLDYLHTGTDVQYRVVHRDVKSSNILLDENWTGKIADFGLSRTTPAPQSGSTTNAYTGQVMGTFGYMDAEYFSTHRLTRKTDVYAFGVVLLEVLCGRRALDFTLDEQQHSLAGWAKHCIKRGNVRRIVDPYLKGEVPAKILKKFGQIAYECLRTPSKDRPTMTMVLARLESVLLAMQSVQTTSTLKHIAWSLFFTKVPRRPVYDSVRAATASQEVVPPSGMAAAPILKKFTFSELKTATRNFRPDVVIGEGGFGRVYKGWLDRVTYAPVKAGHGLPVAVKALSPTSYQGLEEWQAEVKLLGRLSHPNLVKLLGYCLADGKFLLVYEYMQNESLEKHLFKQVGKALPWYTRIKIAVGAAEGLAFLHTLERNIIWRDAKCSNILLDGDFNAKLSDFGLSRLGVDAGEKTHVSTAIVGTYGYAAPEYLATGHLYVKSDVYSFGVIMLEIITGLRVLDRNRPASKQNLVNWAKPLIRKKKGILGIMDPRLEQNYPPKAALKTAELIVNCLEPEPKKRPAMTEIVSCLQDIDAIKMEPPAIQRLNPLKNYR